MDDGQRRRTPAEHEPELELEPLKPNGTWSQRVIRWQLGSAKGNESIRWCSLDDRWVAIALGEGDEIGRAVITCSDGRRLVVDSYENALIVAETWRS